ncbi:hypothetical protein ElyMa_004955500 [Elysia marginata]|uniref:Uncharacterized protein n=1 Tax=Elysia marginata TaxID=1093978 RepID=A0AAV4J738_9GAST|nr:hypothetical protein ElyMa_004955500 [Elysia marginata]
MSSSPPPPPPGVDKCDKEDTKATKRAALKVSGIEVAGSCALPGLFVQTAVGSAFVITRDFGDLQVADVSPKTDRTINQVFLFGLRVHPCCFVLAILSEEHVGNSHIILYAVTFDNLSLCPSTPFQFLKSFAPPVLKSLADEACRFAM